MDFQVRVLKVLVSYPDGFACLDDLKREESYCANAVEGLSIGRLATRLGGGKKVPKSILVFAAAAALIASQLLRVR